MRGADKVVVNSKFTMGVALETFGEDLGGGQVDVVYPCVDTGMIEGKGRPKGPKPFGEQKFILSVNRFERKKAIERAIHAFHGLDATKRSQAKLVIAGGYDSRVHENVEYHHELEQLCDKLSLTHSTKTNTQEVLAADTSVEVLFCLNVDSKLKETLLAHASLLVYTPSNEHFGIVPVEAMLYGTPVLACNSGGPTETIADGETGWIRDADDMREWTHVLDEVLFNWTSADKARATQKGQERVKQLFSRTIMAERLEKVIQDMRAAAKRPEFLEWNDVLLAVGVAGLAIFALIAVWFKGPAKPVQVRKRVKTREL